MKRFVIAVLLLPMAAAAQINITGTSINFPDGSILESAPPQGLKRTIYVAATDDAIANGAALMSAYYATVVLGDAGPATQYVLALDPARYDLSANTLLMSPYISIRGAGLDRTTIDSSNETGPAIQQPSATTIQELTVNKNSAGTGGNGEGILITGPNAIIHRVKVRINGAFESATAVAGIHVVANSFNPSVVVTDIQIYMNYSGSGLVRGLWAENTLLFLDGFYIDASNTATLNRSIEVTASGGFISNGIFVDTRVAVLSNSSQMRLSHLDIDSGGVGALSVQTTGTSSIVATFCYLTNAFSGSGIAAVNCIDRATNLEI